MTAGAATMITLWTRGGRMDVDGSFRVLYFDKEGAPISMQRWGELRWHMDDDGRVSEYARVGDDHVGAVWVSTVWLGIDHGFGHGPPQIFETMIFGSEAEFNPVCRYATEADAVAGHWRTVADLKAGRPVWFEHEENEDG